jgi:transposase
MAVKNNINYRRMSESRKLEARRTAIRHYQKGETVESIARHYGVSRQTVYNWIEAYQNDPKGGLEHAKRGRKPRLDDEDLNWLRQELLKGPVEYGHLTNLWTCSRVAQVVKKELGVQLHPSQILRILRQRMGFSFQKPARRANERDGEKN